MDAIVIAIVIVSAAVTVLVAMSVIAEMEDDRALMEQYDMRELYDFNEDRGSMTMNDDLIRRSDAIEAIEEVDWYHQNKNKDMISGANSAEHQAWYKADDVYKALEAVPSADRSQGEWLDTGNWMGIECSRCKCHSRYVTPFCPQCGARMKGADDE